MTQGFQSKTESLSNLPRVWKWQKKRKHLAEASVPFVMSQNARNGEASPYTVRLDISEDFRIDPSDKTEKHFIAPATFGFRLLA